MKSRGGFAMMILVISLAVLACGASAPAEAVAQVQLNTMTPSPEAATATPPAVPTEILLPSPSPTTAQLRLEIVKSQAWADRDGNVRVNFLLRNPYDFPIAPEFGASANLVNSAGQSVRAQELYFLDGISGGSGFILPGETIAANACFTCEKTPLTEEWSSVEIASGIEDATGIWNYSTDVGVKVGDVSFDSDSSIFWVKGKVKNNSDKTLSRISARVFVYDEEGNLVGAAEASAWGCETR
jgi:hypothetical protein